MYFGWVWHEDLKDWRYRALWMVSLNFVLRCLQPGVRNKLVFYVRCQATEPMREDAAPRNIGWGIGRVKHTPGWWR